MDFSAWFEVYLENRWWTFDARHNTPRIGRVLMATGRDAADAATHYVFRTSLSEMVFVVTDEEILSRPHCKKGSAAALHLDLLETFPRSASI